MGELEQHKDGARPRGQLFRRFGRQADGATAVEFGLIAAPFLFILFAIIDLGLAFIAASVLENATQDVSRQIMLGQARAQNWTSDIFRDRICGRVNMLMNCPRLRFDVRSYASFNGLQLGAVTDPTSNQFTLGAGSAVMVVRVAYPWPTLLPNFGMSIGATPTGDRVLLSTATFRNEPF